MLVKNTKVPICNYHQGIQAERKRILDKFKPLIILLDRIDNGEYFNKDDEELEWRKNLEALKKEVENEK